MEVIVTKQRNVNGWSAYAARKYAKGGDPEQTQTAGLQDHKAADAVTRYHTGRRSVPAVKEILLQSIKD